MARIKVQDFNFQQKAPEFIEFAEKRFGNSKEISVTEAKQHFGVGVAIIEKLFIEAVNQGLTGFKLIYDKPKQAVVGAKNPVLNERGTVVVPKFFIEQFNAQNPDNRHEKGQEYEVAVEADRIVLTKTG